MKREHLTARQLAERFPGKPIEINPARFRTRSPLRNDRTPSVYITETPEGTILVKDFGGDSVAEMLGAIGVNIASLFPPKPDQHYAKPTRASMAVNDLIRFIGNDLRLVLVAARMTSNKEALAERDMTLLGEAIERITDGLNFAGYRHA